MQSVLPERTASSLMIRSKYWRVSLWRGSIQNSYLDTREWRQR